MSAAQRRAYFIGLLLTVFGAGLAFGKAGEDYPRKPLRFLTTGVGASTDFAARLVAQGLSDSVGWNIVVENRGSTIIASETAAEATPDGYTLLVSTDGLWRGPLLQKMSYDPVKDFEPITLVSRSPNILVVPPSLPVKSVQELIAYARANPGKLNYGAGAIGASTHLAAELFNLMAHVKIVPIRYKSTGPALIDLMGGRLQVMFATTGGVTPHIRSGKLRALAISTLKRSTLVPELPTIAEAGDLPGYESASTAGIFAPAKTPRTIIRQVNREVMKVLKRPEVKEKFFRQGVEILGTTPRETAAFVKSDMAKTAEIIKAAGINLHGK